jgi:hypothetical protein
LSAGATLYRKDATAGSKQSWNVSGSSERELGIEIRRGVPSAVGASRTTGLGASTERLLNEGFDGSRASAAFSAAAEAAIELLGIAGQIFR